MSAKEKFPYYWICRTCAKERGGVPSAGVCTMIQDICKYCEGEKQTEVALAPWIDYDWPNDREATRRARNARD